MKLDRSTLARQICTAIDPHIPRLTREWQNNAPVNHVVLDNVLAAEAAHAIRAAFPPCAEMTLKRSLREVKYVAAQMNRYDPLLEEAIYAFQDPEVVARVQAITGLRALEPDEMLYAGGISLMAPGHFLNPHVDNSHDRNRKRYRVLNLLYYVSPDWEARQGCNLELWPQGPRGAPVTVVSRFNRLAVMVTHQASWHSVSCNVSTQDRCCVSNYYFSRFPVGEREYFHVTSFRGRPEQPLRDLILRCDSGFRQAIRRLRPAGLKQLRHYYDRQA